MVFQTTPPQPASKAFMAWWAVLGGGPDASQKGFGLVIPANLTVRSAIDSPVRHFEWSRCFRGARRAEPYVQSTSRSHAFGNSIYNFFAAIGAITCGEILGVASLV